MEIYLNLLPKEKKDRIRRKRISGLIIGQEIFLVFIALVLISVLISINFILGLQEDVVENEALTVNTGEYKEMKNYENLFSKTNKEVNFLLNMQEKHILWTNYFKRVDEIIPKGITVKEMANNNYTILMSGVASTREVLLDFKNKIEADNCFSEINVPLSNIVVRENVDFQVDFVIKKECLNE